MLSIGTDTRNRRPLYDALGIFAAVATKKPGAAYYLIAPCKIAPAMRAQTTGIGIFGGSSYWSVHGRPATIASGPRWDKIAEADTGRGELLIPTRALPLAIPDTIARGALPRYHSGAVADNGSVAKEP